MALRSGLNFYSKFGTANVATHWHSPAPALQPHRLMDPSDQLREVRIKLRNLLHDEYVETKDLNKVLNWTDEMREKGVSKTPLIDLIGKIHYLTDNKNEEDKNKRLLLILPLYNALLHSPEATPFVGRAELYTPAIANLFKFNSADTLIAAVQSFWSQIGCCASSAEANRILSPSQMSALRVCFCKEFRKFVYQLPTNEFVSMLPQLCDAIRQNGLFLKAPLATAVDAVKGLEDKRMLRKAYAEFIGTATERQLFTDRLHIYFPWMLGQLGDYKGWFVDKRASTKKLGIVLQLIHHVVGGNQMASSSLPSSMNHPTGGVRAVPRFLVDCLHNSLSWAFSWACASRDFAAADQIWQFTFHSDAKQQQQQQHHDQQQIRHYTTEGNFPTNFLLCDMLTFTAHLWTTGNTQRAQQIMHFYLGKQFAFSDGQTHGKIHKILDELNMLNTEYRHNLFKIKQHGVGGAAAAASDPKKLHRDFVTTIRAMLQHPRMMKKNNITMTTTTTPNSTTSSNNNKSWAAMASSSSSSFSATTTTANATNAGNNNNNNRQRKQKIAVAIS